MRRTLALLMVVATFSLAAACKSRKDSVEAAYTTWDAAQAEADTAEEKLAATRVFLDRYPDTSHTEEVASTLAYLLTDALGRPAEADEYLVALTGKVHTPEARTAVLGIRLGVLGALKDGARLRQAVEEFSQGRDLKFSDRSTIADAALKAGAWDLALSTADAAMPLATPDAIKAENPKRTYSDQRLADNSRRRKVEMLGAKGWALANLGRTDEALATLREAYDTDFHGYMGNTESAAASYLGRALEMAGRHSEADAPLAVAALYGGDEDARRALRARFPTTAIGDQALDAFLGEERRRLARPVTDFTLPDYAGAPQTFSRLRNGEVTLLSFWFPT